MPDNRRLRFLLREEAHGLLTALKAASPPAYEMALLALSCGLRAGEIFNLRWGDVSLENGTLAIRDSKKNVITAHVYMTAEVLEIIRAKEPRTPAPQTLLFPDRDGGQRKEVPPIFKRTVDRMGLNEGVTDRRDRLVFHSLRHSYASWLAEAGVSPQVIRERMRHKTLIMTDRYMHLAPDAGRGTVAVIGEIMTEKPTVKAALRVVK